VALVLGAGLQATTASSMIPGFEAFLPVSMTVSPCWFSLVANLDASTAAFLAVLALAAVLRSGRGRDASDGTARDVGVVADGAAR
jgi:hypothetical protein